MEWSKLKNIIIIMLAGVNLFLLVLSFHRQWESQQYHQSAREDAIAVLWETCRVRIDEDSLPEEADLAPLTVTRDAELEAAQATALLGTLTAAPPAAQRYVGAKGSAQFYVNGEFSAELHVGAYPLAGAAPEDFAVATLGGMGIDAQFVHSIEEAGVTVVTVCQLWQGVPVFDCTAALVFREGELRAIERNVSHRLTGSPQREGEEQSLSLVTLLMRFADYVNQNGRMCDELTSFTSGYALDTQTDPARLIPTWYVTTNLDEVDYTWNAMTGEIQRESE